MKKLMPTSYFLFMLVLLILFHFTLPIVKFDYFPYNYLGVALIIFGAVLNLWADNLMKKWETTVKPHLKPTTLITSGPFRFTRHPMYLGMLSILLGSAIVASSLIAFIFSVLYMILMEILYIPMEEDNLKEAFSNEYLEYKRKVRRWI